MRVMAVCLLRIGDILMCAPALRALKSKQKNVELHVLVNSEFSFCRNLFPYVDKFHYFPRKDLQENLGDPSEPILNGFDVLKELLHELNQIGFDELYNFTHNRLSGYLCGAIEANDKHGMHGSNPENLLIDGAWFRFLNRPADQVNLHFSEIFLRSVGADGIEKIAVRENPDSISWALQTLRSFSNGERLIGIQCFSNEEKKQLPFDYWTHLCSHLSSVPTTVLVIAAPWEAVQAQLIVESLQAKQVRTQLVVCTFDQALSLLKRLDCLLTIDTSIKHLASTSDLTIFEFATGGSRPHQTGVFGDQNVIFDIQEWEKFASASAVESVAKGIEMFLQNQELLFLRNIQGAIVYRTRVINQTTWFLEQVNGSRMSQVGIQLLSHVKQIGEIASLDAESEAFLPSSLAFSIANEFQNCLEGFFKLDQLKELQNESHATLSSIKRAHDNLVRLFTGRIHSLDWIEESQKNTHFDLSSIEREILTHFSSKSDVVGITELRKIQEKLNRSYRFESWNLKFIRTLKNHITEKI